MQHVVQPYVDAQMFMGNVLVARAGKVVFSKSYGMADLEWKVPNSPPTRFNIASMTKQFTAAAILLPEDRGQLKTDDLSLSKEVLARYAGTYQFSDDSLEVLPEGNHLLFKFDNGSDLPVFPESETRFFSKPWPIEFEFSKNDSSGPPVLIRHQNGKDEKGTKK